MRRLLPTAVLAAVLTPALLGAAACGGGDARGDTSPPASASAGSAAPSGVSPGVGASAGDRVSGTAGGNAREVCVAAQKSTSQAVMVFVSELGTMMQARSADDAKAAQEAQRKAEGALATWAGAAREHAEKATDPRLKSVLTEIATEVGGMKAELDRVDQTRLDQLQQRLDQLCGT